MLQGYVDDSGSASEGRRLYLAGYIMAAERWKDFSSDWQRALDAPPAVRSLHMAVSFRGWSRQDRAKKLDQLVSVLRAYRPLSIECRISAEDYKSIVAPEAPHDLRHAYGVCFHAFLVQSALMIHGQGLQGPLDFVFDEQGNVGLDAAIWYEVIKQLPGPPVSNILGGAPIFRSDDEVLPLQAADMLAWHRRAVGEPNCAEHVKKFADSIVFTHGISEVPREMLQKWAVEFAAIPHIEETKGRKGTVKHAVARIVSSVPPERVVPVMEAIARRGRYMGRIRSIMLGLGLKRLWRWIAKRPTRYS